NVAARLQQAAESWGILCGERTVGSIRAGFSFGPTIAIEARGKTQPIRAVVLLGRDARQPVAARTPLIGRGPDLQQLELVAGRRAPAGGDSLARSSRWRTRLGRESPQPWAAPRCWPAGGRSLRSRHVGRRLSSCSRACTGRATAFSISSNS